MKILTILKGINSNSFSSRIVGLIFRNYVKYEHDFESKLQRAKKIPGWWEIRNEEEEVDEDFNKVKKVF